MISTAPETRLRLLGGATLEGDHGPISGRGAQRRRIALLAILAGMRRPVSRDKIVGLLWEEADSERARKLLSESLYVIRKAIGEDALVARGDDVRLNPNLVWCDVTEFHAALDRGDDAAAALIYSGPFLDGFFISDAPEFEKWADGVRDTLARTHADALMRLAGGSEKAGDLDASAGWWRRLAEQDPYNATYALGLMRVLEQTGQRAAALQHARTHAALLRTEFDADPDPAIAALVEKLKERAPTVAARKDPEPVAQRRPGAAAQPRSPDEAPTPTPIASPLRSQSQSPSPSRPVLEARPKKRPKRSLAGAVLLALLGALAIVALRDSAAPPGEDPAIIVAILPFDVRGADVLLREGVAELLSTNLHGAGDLQAVDSNALLSYMANDDGAITPGQGAAIAKRFGAAFYVLGDVTRIGDQVQLHATLYSVNDTTTESATVRGAADSVLVLVDELAAKLVTARGISVDQLTQLAAQTTTSYPALKKYLEGGRHYRAARYEEAVESFTDATALDPQFALAYYRLSASAEWNFDFRLARRAAQRAIENSVRLPEHYAPLVRAWQFFLNGNAAEAEREYGAIVTKYSNDIEARSGLGEVLVHFNPTRGESSDEARAAFDRVLALAPAHGEVRYHAMEFAARDRDVVRFDALLKTIGRDNLQYYAWRAVRAFTWGTPAEQALVMRELGRAGELEIGLAAARVAAHTHNFDAARSIARELTGSDRTTQWQAGARLIIAELHLAAGNSAEALREIDAAARLEEDWSMELGSLFMLHPAVVASADDLRRQQAKLLAWDPGAHTPSTTFFLLAHVLDHSRLRFYLLGLISARLNDVESARKFRTSLEQVPSGAGEQQFGAALSQSLAGHIAIAEGDSARGLELLVAAHVDASPEAIAVSPFYSRAHDRLVIAELYAAAGKKAEARNWYQSLTEGHDFMYAKVARARLEQLAGR